MLNTHYHENPAEEDSNVSNLDHETYEVALYDDLRLRKRRMNSVMLLWCEPQEDEAQQEVLVIKYEERVNWQQAHEDEDAAKRKSGTTKVGARIVEKAITLLS